MASDRGFQEIFDFRRGGDIERAMSDPDRRWLTDQLTEGEFGPALDVLDGMRGLDEDRRELGGLIADRAIASRVREESLPIGRCLATLGLYPRVDPVVNEGDMHLLADLVSDEETWELVHTFVCGRVVAIDMFGRLPQLPPGSWVGRRMRPCGGCLRMAADNTDALDREFEAMAAGAYRRTVLALTELLLVRPWSEAELVAAADDLVYETTWKTVVAPLVKANAVAVAAVIAPDGGLDGDRVAGEADRIAELAWSHADRDSEGALRWVRRCYLPKPHHRRERRCA